jgi:hypothetical protein
MDTPIVYELDYIFKKSTFSIFPWQQKIRKTLLHPSGARSPLEVFYALVEPMVQGSRRAYKILNVSLHDKPL